MKILFVCSSIDFRLKKIVKILKDYDEDVDILDIVEYKFIYSGGKEIYIRPKTKYKSLEYFFIFDEINEYARRREIFDYLDRYDLVHIYKAEYFAVDFKDKIESISLRYVITPNNKILKNSKKIYELFKNASGIIYFDEFLKQKYKSLYNINFNSIVLHNPVEKLSMYDKIDKNIVKKFVEFLDIDGDRVNVFCQFSGSKIKQKNLLIRLVNLSHDIKLKTTFIIYLDNEDERFNTQLNEFLKQKKLDYVILNNSAEDEQVMMSIMVSEACIFIEHEVVNELLLVAIYAKKHIFLHEPRELDIIFKEKKIFLDNFEQFKFLFEKDEINRGLYEEIFKRNHNLIKNLFHPEKFTSDYLKFIME